MLSNLGIAANHGAKSVSSDVFYEKQVAVSKNRGPQYIDPFCGDLQIRYP